METEREYLRNHFKPLIDAVEAEIPDAFEWAKPIALLQLSDSFWRYTHGPDQENISGNKKPVNRDIKETGRKPSSGEHSGKRQMITEPQLGMIKKHINGKNKENILKFLDNRRPSELTKYQAHLLISMITEEKDWEFEEGIIYA